ncbi:hypothetical protein NKJ13_03235 [Mesorhizobium sp. M0174]|uniref:hypothetical protein n=1 Tax=Mesorhizobium sp. M0174 TaxID=2956904 RepID=UPI00333CC237
MPLAEHSVFRRPAKEQVLWRYMNFPKFASMITTKILWFSNMHTLSVDDPYEGILPAGNYAHRQWNNEADVPQKKLNDIKRGSFIGKGGDIKSDIKAYKALLDNEVDEAYNARKENYINCWHISSYESASMWHIYGERQFGIAVTSDINSIAKAFNATKEEIFAGSVDYIDYESETLDMSNGFIPALHKRLSFGHEKEMRLLIWDFSDSEMDVLFPLNGTLRVMKGERPKAERDKIDPAPGKAVRCDLSELILGIYVSPASPIWFEDAVRSFCELARIDKRIVRSDLLAGPVR